MILFSYLNYISVFLQIASDSLIGLVSTGCYNKVTQTGWLKNITFVSHSSGSWKSEIRVPAKLLFDEGLPLGWKRHISRCILTWQKEDKLALWPALIRALILL